MKQTFICLILLVFLAPSQLYSKDFYVKGYYPKNGTYVRPHIRNSPDNYKWNNYGPSKNYDQPMNPEQRDNDMDEIPNYLDKDDVSGYGNSGYVNCSIETDGDTEVTGYLTNEDGDKIQVEGEWTGNGEVEVYYVDGNYYELEVD